MSLNRSRWAALGAAVAVSAGAGGIGFAQAGSDSAGSSYVAMIPCRMLDTRTDADIDALRGAETITLEGRGLVGDCEIPANATGLSVNIAAVAPSANTYLTAFPTGTDLPSSSHVNARQGTTTSNGVDVTLSADGQLDIYNRTGKVDVVVDVLGAYVPAASGEAIPGPVGAKGATGPMGPQGPAGPAAAGMFRRVAADLELEETWDNGDVQGFSYFGPLDNVCGDDAMVSGAITPDDEQIEVNYFFLFADGRFGPYEGSDPFADKHMIESSIIVHTPERESDGVGNETIVVPIEVMCFDQPAVEGESDGIPENDIATGMELAPAFDIEAATAAAQEG